MTFRRNGTEDRDLVFLGPDGHHPADLPVTVPADLAPLSPVIEKPFRPEKPGLYIYRHRGDAVRSRAGKVEPLDEQTLRQLRSLGYLR